MVTYCFTTPIHGLDGTVRYRIRDDLGRMFEVTVDADGICRQCEKAATNASKRAVDGAVTVKLVRPQPSVPVRECSSEIPTGCDFRVGTSCVHRPDSDGVRPCTQAEQMEFDGTTIDPKDWVPPYTLGKIDSRWVIRYKNDRGTRTLGKWFNQKRAEMVLDQMNEAASAGRFDLASCIGDDAESIQEDPLILTDSRGFLTIERTHDRKRWVLPEIYSEPDAQALLDRMLDATVYGEHDGAEQMVEEVIRKLGSPAVGQATESVKG